MSELDFSLKLKADIKDLQGKLAEAQRAFQDAFGKMQNLSVELTENTKDVEAALQKVFAAKGSDALIGAMRGAVKEVSAHR